MAVNSLDPADDLADALSLAKARSDAEKSSDIIPFARGSKRLRRIKDKREREEAGEIPVIGYGRLSRDRTGLSTSLERQESETRTWAPLAGFRIVDWLSDDDTTAFGLDTPRPGFDEARRWLAERREGVRGLVGWKVDRLVRRTADWSLLLPRGELTPWLIATLKDNVRTDTAAGRMTAAVLVAMAELESENIRMRTWSKHSELAREGKWSGGGSRAYGHNAPVVGDNGVVLKRGRSEIVEEEAEVLREIAGRIISGEPVVRIAGDLERRGVVGIGGKSVAAPTWRRMMLSPRLVGKRLDDDGRLSAEAGMAPILDDDTARAVWAALDRPSGSAGIGTARSRMLSGLLICGNAGCGRPLKPWKDHGKPAFACLKVPGRGGCGQTSIIQAPVERVVVETALRYLERIDLHSFAEKASNLTSQLVNQLKLEDAKLEDLARHRFDTGTITDAEFQSARLPIMQRRDELLRQINSGRRAPVISTGSVRQAWGQWNFFERRQALEAAIEKVTVGPGYEPRKQNADGSYPRGRPTRRLRPAERLKVKLRRI